MSKNEEEFWKALVRGLAHESEGLNIALSLMTLMWILILATAYFT